MVDRYKPVRLLQNEGSSIKGGMGSKEGPAVRGVVGKTVFFNRNAGQVV